MKLSFKEFGEGDPLIILHGLYGCSDNWVSIGKVLAQYFKVYIPDHRNHGDSPHSDEFSYDLMKGDLLEFMNNHEIKKAIILGHSMGGKTAMAFTASSPERVSKLVVVDISPKSHKGGNSPIINFHKTVIDSLFNIDLDKINTRRDADNILSSTIPDQRLRQFLLKNLRRDDDKRFYWKLNIKSIKKNIDNIMDGIDENICIENIPALFIKGEESGYLKEERFPLIKSIFPRAEIKTIPNAGHWVHAEQPGLFLKSVLEFLK